MANIYKLEIGNEFYIGSTCNLTSRLHIHKSRTYNENDKRYNEKIYTAIRNINWNNVKIHILEICNKEVIKQREQYFIDTLKPTLNSFRVIKDKDYFKKWNINIQCECGGKYDKSHKNRHHKSNKHLNYLSQINI